MSKKFFTKTSVLCFIGIAVLGFVLRVYNLTTLPIFVDEAIYIRWAQVMRADETLRFLPLSDGKQPLFMWIVIPFLKIFSDPVIAGRIVSVFSGTATIVLSTVITWQLFKSRRTSLITAVLVAICPYLVFFDRLALVDSLLTFWVMLALLMAVVLVKSPRLDLALLGGAAFGGAWLTKSSGQLYLFLLPFVFLLISKKNLSNKVYWFKLLGSVLIIWIVGIGFYNLLRLGPNFHLINSRNSDYIYSFSEILNHPQSPLISNLKVVASWLSLLMPLPVFVLTIAGAVIGFLAASTQTVMLLLWSALPLIGISAIAKVFTARYLLPVIPPLIIISALGASKIFSKSAFSKITFLSLIVLPMFGQDLLFSTNPALAWIPKNESHGYLEEWTSGKGLSEIANYLKIRPANKPILVGTEGFFGTTPDGLQIYLEGKGNIRVIGLAFPITEVPQPLKNSLLDNEVYLVVNQSRFKINNPSQEGLILISSFTRPARPDGSSESLLFFRYQGK